MKRLYAAVATAGIILTLHYSRVLHAQEYEVRLTRASKVGDKYRLSTSGQDLTKIVVFIGNNPVHQNVDALSVELTSEVTLLEVDARGGIVKFALDIEGSAVTAGGTTRALLPPGSVVVGTSEGYRTVFKMNEAPVDPLTARALDIVASFGSSDVSDDDVFGTRDKKRVGDSWDINAEVAAKSFKRMLNLATNKDDVKGVSTLDAVVKGGNEDYLVVSAWLVVNRLSLPLPDGLSIENGQLKGEFSGRFPTNLVLHSPVHSMKLAAWFVGSRPADAKAPEMRLQGAMERSVKREIESLK